MNNNYQTNTLVASKEFKHFFAELKKCIDHQNLILGYHFHDHGKEYSEFEVKRGLCSSIGEFYRQETSLEISKKTSNEMKKILKSIFGYEYVTPFNKDICGYEREKLNGSLYYNPDRLAFIDYVNSDKVIVEPD